ncbi:MAG: hypothetical protein IH923_02855, partial [Nitrospinae bacterium]|nr:hypothetical protein [Nitrospinota bacterium]
YLDQPPASKKDGKSETHVDLAADNGWKALSGEETLQDKVGERIYSRLVEMCRFVKLEGMDYRQEMQGKQTAPARSRKKK